MPVASNLVASRANRDARSRTNRAQETNILAGKNLWKDRSAEVPQKAVPVSNATKGCHQTGTRKTTQVLSLAGVAAECQRAGRQNGLIFAIPFFFFFLLDDSRLDL